MKKFLLSTLLFIGGILGSIQSEGPVFQWAKSLDWFSQLWAVSIVSRR